MSQSRWILAFDSSCGRCRRISEAVTEVAKGKLEVLPLTNADVVRWRSQSLGPDPAWTPTLLKVDGSGASKAWTGRAMTVPMMRLLGLQATGTLLRTLGELRSTDYGQVAAAPSGIGRRQLFHVGAGAALVGAMMLGGGLEARANPADTWVRKNIDRLPQTYDEVVAHPIEYRKAIYARLAPATRSQLWTEQLTRYRSAHPELSAAQRDAIALGLEITSTPATFDHAQFATAEPRLQQLRNTMTKAFEHEEARRLIAVLGPEGLSNINISCECASDSNWCDPHGPCYVKTQCTGDPSSGLCGTLLTYKCDGFCTP